jgi:hypothetical protein
VAVQRSERRRNRTAKPALGHFEFRLSGRRVTAERSKARHIDEPLDLIGPGPESVKEI